MLLRRRFNFKERFTFFNFMGLCLSIEDTALRYRPERLDWEHFKYNEIFLRMDEIRTFKRFFPAMHYYFDDYLRDTGFEECDYDVAMRPFYDIELALEKKKRALEENQKHGIDFIAAELRPYFNRDMRRARGDFEEDFDDEEMMTQSVAVKIDEEHKRPELLIDEATKHYLLDNPGQNNMFNLTLTNYP